MFTRGIETDTNYPRAYAGIADCCSFLYIYFESTKANLKEAYEASRRALDLDPLRQHPRFQDLLQTRRLLD